MGGGGGGAAAGTITIAKATIPPTAAAGATLRSNWRKWKFSRKFQSQRN